jgi:dTDP-4-amino-4,6-dideoxygalactose transaminase
VAEEMSKKVLSLPMGPYLDLDSLTRVADALLPAAVRWVIS